MTIRSISLPTLTIKINKLTTSMTETTKMITVMIRIIVTEIIAVTTEAMIIETNAAIVMSHTLVRAFLSHYLWTIHTDLTSLLQSMKRTLTLWVSRMATILRMDGHDHSLHSYRDIMQQKIKEAKTKGIILNTCNLVQRPNYKK